MTDWMKDQEEEMDNQLEELLGSIKEVPPRSPEARAQGLAQFVAEIDAVMEEEDRKAFSPFLAWLPGWLINIRSRKEKLTMPTFTRNPVLTLATLVAVIVVFLFGGVTVTAQASRSALPGDALYSVKTGLEQARLAMTNDLSVQAELHLTIAQTRLSEINDLVAAGRYDNIPELAGQFQEHIQKALEAIQALATIDPARAAQLNIEISAALSGFNANLANVMSNIPEQIRNQVQEAINASQDDLSNENTNQSVDDANDNSGEDNSNTGVENETNGNDDNGNTTSDDNANNANDDTNVNCSVNDNQPGCDDQNTNDGGNGNGSDDGGNGNGSDDGGNDNGSDDGGNDNGSDDGGNDNGSDDGGNDNGSDDGGNDNGSDGGGNDNGSDGGGNDNGSDSGGNDNGSDSGSDNDSSDDSSGGDVSSIDGSALDN